MANTGPSALVVKVVRERDGWRCVKCGSGHSLTTQHRIGRGMGGTKEPAINYPSNLITLCGSGTTGCHGWVEDHPIEAQLYGWRLWRHEDPADVPVRSATFGWILLADDGSYEFVDNGEPAMTSTALRPVDFQENP